MYFFIVEFPNYFRNCEINLMVELLQVLELNKLSLGDDCKRLYQ
jgi:hypothetical protein